MRKVKFAQQSFSDRLKQILDDFPRLEGIHPFYSDLINVLYDKDHYKLALGQLNIARNLIDNVGRDFIKLLKFGDSLYRCKSLKRAALGRMCTIIKKNKASLAYLEQVRQHLSRLPSIDPKTRTLLITGYPNCGKSSFINKITRADVEVQPYAFTTKSLYVGHTDYKYARWQVIDTPGILDHPLEERNTIEMQAITALAHLQATVLFFIDVSGFSDYSIAQQVSLFNSLKPLFLNKPIVIVASKTDVRPLEALPKEEMMLLEEVSRECSAPIISISNVTDDGLLTVKNKGCDMLLEQRLDSKINSSKANSVLNRIHISVPKPRDSTVRSACIPESVFELKQADTMIVDDELSNPDPLKVKKTIKEIEEENGGAGVYSYNWREHWELENDDWKYDDIPELFLGKNVMDYYDPEISSRLDALEVEEAEIVAELGRNAGSEDVVMSDDEDEEIREMAKQVRHKKKIMAELRKVNLTKNYPIMPRTSLPRVKRETVVKQLQDVGVTVRGRSRDVKPLGEARKRARSADVMEIDGKPRDRSISARNPSVISAISRLRSRSPSCFSTPSQAARAEVLRIKKRKLMGPTARKGEGDRHIPTLKPKHLFSGKRGIGKTDRR